MITPDAFNRIRHLTLELVNVYHSVNSTDTQQAIYAQVIAEINQLTQPSPTFIDALQDKTLTKETAEKLLLEIKETVNPFEMPDKTHLKKLFKKVKKLQVPDVSSIDLRQYSYFAWDDLASHRKYLLADYQGKLIGLYGTISEQQQKNTCAICSQTSQVVQFMALTKSRADGTYVKNGNYICLDSHLCNQQMQNQTGLLNFLATIQPK